MKTKIFIVSAFVAATVLTLSFTNSSKKEVKHNVVNTTQEDYSAPAGGSGSIRI